MHKKNRFESSTTSTKMSSQSYYKDRLGFDPREALYDGPVKGGSRGHSQNSQYTSSTANGNDNYATPPKKQKQQQQQQQSHQSQSHQSQSHQSLNQSQHEQSPQGGYEDALTQFKGTMSLWEHFVENTDIIGMLVKESKIQIQTKMHADVSCLYCCWFFFIYFLFWRFLLFFCVYYYPK